MATEQLSTTILDMQSRKVKKKPSSRQGELKNQTRNSTDGAVQNKRRRRTRGRKKEGETLAPTGYHNNSNTTNGNRNLRQLKREGRGKRGRAKKGGSGSRGGKENHEKQGT